jgi:hypothetical protein
MVLRDSDNPPFAVEAQRFPLFMGTRILSLNEEAEGFQNVCEFFV